MNHHPKTTALVSIQIAAQQINEAATRALALIAADTFAENVLGPSIEIQLDNLAFNAQVWTDALKSIEEMRC